MSAAALEGANDDLVALLREQCWHMRGKRALLFQRAADRIESLEKMLDEMRKRCPACGMEAKTICYDARCPYDRKQG